MKRLLTILILSLVVMMAQAGIKTVTFAGLKYAVDTDRQVAQLIQQEVKIKGDLVIPDTIKYKDKASGKYIHCPVVSIAPYALAGQKGIKSLYIPASVTSIGDYAFANCKKLRHARFGSSLGLRANHENWFAGAKKLEIDSVLMPGESVSIY
ncbi:MAG: leucine-rich repeat protein [Paludibacteraceae bacterium]|nr:leucine-rich repeat protein [Paludibacteraceae bacterium]